MNDAKHNFGYKQPQACFYELINIDTDKFIPKKGLLRVNENILQNSPYQKLTKFLSEFIWVKSGQDET